MGRRAFVAEFPACAWRAAPRSALRLIDADLRAGSMRGPYTSGRRVDNFRMVLPLLRSSSLRILLLDPARPPVGHVVVAAVEPGGDGAEGGGEAVRDAEGG